MGAVSHYHAHVYFDPADEALAGLIRRQVASQLGVRVGSLHRQPVGPHPKGMFQLVFTAAQHPAVVDWLARHRQGLDILIHPETGDDLADHRDSARWLGNALPLDLSVLR